MSANKVGGRTGSKVVSLILVLVLVLAFLPAQTFVLPQQAYAADVDYHDYLEDGQHVTPADGVSAYKESAFYHLDNNYIHFYVPDNGQPLCTKPSIIGNWSFQYPKFYLYSQYRVTGTIVQKTASVEVTPSSVNVSFQNDANGPFIRAIYSFQAYNVSVTHDFHLVRLVDTPEHVNNYGVQVTSTFSGEIPPFPPILGPDQSTGESNFRWSFVLKEFPVMGHNKLYTSEEMNYMRLQVLSRDYKGNTTSADLLGSQSETYANTGGTKTITEIVGSSYGWAIPFVSISNFDGHPYHLQFTDTNTAPWANDHWPFRYSNAYSYNKDPNSAPTVNNIYDHGLEIFNVGDGHTLWGFRSLLNVATEDTPPDEVIIPQTATRLGIFKNGDGYSVKTAATEQEITQLGQTYGAPVAVLRGDVEKKNNQYEFTDGKVAISFTVTATWDKSNGGKFIVDSDGTITQSGVNLNAPSFKFYMPKTGKESSLQLGFSDDGLTATITPANNAASISTDIAYSSTQLEKAVADVDGNLSFSGHFSVTTIFDGASFSLKALGYGPKVVAGKTEFRLNGIHAAGSFDTAALIGLKLAKVKGEINTFPSAEVPYSFEAELDVFSLFEAQAELELKRLARTSVLMPNNLYFKAGSDLVGIPLVPPVTVGTLKKVGGGFYGLADTVNGNFFAVPPIKLKATAGVSLLNFVDAEAELVFGPGHWEESLSDIKLTGTGEVNVIKKLTRYVDVSGQTRSYAPAGEQPINYTGLQLMGGASLEANFPSVQHDWIVVNGGLDFGAFAGLNSYTSPSKLYLLVGGNGKVAGRLKFPEEIKGLGGRTILNADIEAALGVQTVVTVNEGWQEAAESLYKNAAVYFGVKGEASIIGWGGRVYYLVPPSGATKLGFQVDTWFNNLDKWVWSDYGIPSFSALAAVQDDSGEQVGLMGVDFNMPEFSVPGGEGASLQPLSTTQNISFAAADSAADDSIYILIKTDSVATDEEIEAFLDSLVVTGPSGTLALNWLKDLPDEATAAEFEATNAIAGINEEDGLCGVMVYVGKGGIDQSFTVEADSAFTFETGISHPFASFEASLSGYSLSGQVKNPETGKTYLLRTYLGTEQGGTDYLIDQSVVSNPAAIGYTVPASGTDIPSGSYYVTAYVVEEIREDFNGDGSIADDEVAYLTVGSGEEFGTPILYTNTLQPAAPAGVAITAVGNEVMQSQWHEVSGADGYQVTIYQQDGGTWVDTGSGYQFDAVDFSSVTGISYDSASGTYVMDMALTVGGEGVDEEGAGDGASTALDANKNYKIGVQAYTYLVDSDGVGGNDSYPVYSNESQSNEAYLPAYVALDLSLSVDGNGLVADPATGIYTVSITGDDALLEAFADQNTADFTVTRMDTGAAIGKVSQNVFEIPGDFEGTLMLKVEGSYDHDGVTDTTDAFMVVQLDDTLPIITLDSNLFFADPETGTFTVTGITEPGTLIESSDVADGDGNPVNATAGPDGRFALPGVLQEQYALYTEDGTMEASGFVGGLVTLTAVDSAGNLSDPAAALINSALPDPVYGISFGVASTTFPAATEGYGQQTPFSATLTNTGDQATGALNIALLGANADAFELSASSLASIALGGNGTFTVAPKIGLAPGTYAATVTVTGANGIAASFDVSFTVQAANPNQTTTPSTDPNIPSTGDILGSLALATAVLALVLGMLCLSVRHRRKQAKGVVQAHDTTRIDGGRVP